MKNKKMIKYLINSGHLYLLGIMLVVLFVGALFKYEDTFAYGVLVSLLVGLIALTGYKITDSIQEYRSND